MMGKTEGQGIKSESIVTRVICFLLTVKIHSMRSLAFVCLNTFAYLLILLEKYSFPYSQQHIDRLINFRMGLFLFAY